MTNWIVTQTGRFKAAAAAASICDLEDARLLPDGGEFMANYFREPWENRASYAAHSPINFVEKVTTPLLLQHGERDPRVPVAGAWKMYRALKALGKTVELYIYPRGGHVMYEPLLEREVMARSLAWMSRLPGSAFKGEGPTLYAPWVLGLSPGPPGEIALACPSKHASPSERPVGLARFGSSPQGLKAQQMTKVNLANLANTRNESIKRWPSVAIAADANGRFVANAAATLPESLWAVASILTTVVSRHAGFLISECGCASRNGQRSHAAPHGNLDRHQYAKAIWSGFDHELRAGECFGSSKTANSHSAVTRETAPS
ncbi:MAG TPA: prolyl oligopeptidase family serine peptidase [Thermoanaerobaculia bacterium]|nr:prolyl oligopeptidase family serine peptidase [Thermoanaerobaculia bacterium]